MFVMYDSPIARAAVVAMRPEGTDIHSSFLLFSPLWTSSGRDGRGGGLTIGATLESVTLHLEVDVLSSQVNLLQQRYE